ncbi:extracellular solute-binding protein [Clostridium sp. HBUAS56010]|uniref:extracellular solute-binding protein n=1 Tax=Clostridium sp. HBUAS56010 TaxID=2571127 RepID=UPI0011781709|nr:extracellular solute-binding protein [Clostridium sp. HBUAS56010]
MKKRKLVMWGMAVLTAAVLAAGCSPGDKETAQKGGGQTAQGEEVTIKVMVWDRGDAAPGTTVEKNTQTEWIKKQVKQKYNINVEYVSVPRSSSDDKLNIMMSGGSAPDIVFSYNQSIYYNFAKNGGLADLTQAYETYGSDIRKFAGDAQSMGQIDGKQFAVMKQRGVEAPRHTAYIRQDWLDKLGMEIPKTKDELTAYLQAVKEKNPGGVSSVIPWAMSGRNDTAKNYLNFIGSYVTLANEKDAYIYNEEYMSVAPGAVDGIRKLNELNSKGLLSKDFATDTTEDIYKAQITAGNVGLFLDDTERPWDYITILNQNIGGRTFVPVQCFELSDGSYRTPFEPRHGMFIMIPKSSEKKVEACMKYLNWQADPEVAEDIVYTAEHKRDDKGIPIKLSSEELSSKGYPGTCDDLNLVNLAMEWTKSKEAIVSKWYQDQSVDWEEEKWFDNFYDVRSEGKFRFPVYSNISPAESDYGQNVNTMMIEYVYKLISCAPEQFENVQKAEYDNLVNAGLQKILDARSEYYDSIKK